MPSYAAEELSDHTCLVLSPPHYGRHIGGPDEGNGHHFQAMRSSNRIDSMASVENVPHFGLDAHHFGHTGPVNVGIKYANLHSPFLQRRRQVYYNAGFAHSSLAADDGNFIVYVGHGIADRSVHPVHF